MSAFPKTLPKKLWKFYLPRTSRPHLADMKLEGGIFAKSLCGKSTEKRIRVQPTRSLDGTECQACLDALFPPKSDAVIFTHPTPQDDRKVHMQGRGQCLCGQRAGKYSPTTECLTEVTCQKCEDIIDAERWKAGFR